MTLLLALFSRTKQWPGSVLSQPAGRTASSLPLLLQSVASNPLALPFPQAASMGLGSMQSVGSGQLPQPNGFTPHYAQQLQNQLLMQQGGSFPFLNPGSCAWRSLDALSSASCQILVV